MACKTDTGRAPALVVPGYCRYPNGVRAELWLCKLALPEEAPASWDVYAWKAGHRDFPNDSTAQQLYGDRQFEAYRRLGELAALTALDLMRQPPAPAVVADRLEETLPVAGDGIGPVHAGVVGQGH